ncbi:MAG: MSMEG_0569 family flavin-dependent oxidoreductase [Cyanobacteria bacterium P01_F01_bin.33]
MKTHFPCIIVGGGQAGLSASYCLKQLGIENVIFEKHRIAHAWRSQRWDAFCLVTPNWQCLLPGFNYAGAAPDGFMPKQEIVEYIEAYAKSFNAPIYEGVEVTQVRRLPDMQTYSVRTSAGNFTAGSVVIAAGSYHAHKIPAIAKQLPAGIVQIHSSEYQNPASMPYGATLVVGSGQSGCQIAEDLHFSGREVYLSVGSAPRSPRKHRGKDVVDWLDLMGYYNTPIDTFDDPIKVRKKTNHYLTGRDGGREINLRQLAHEGMKLAGRLDNICNGEIAFKSDLYENLENADAVANSIKASIDTFIADAGIEAPAAPLEEATSLPEFPVTLLDCEQANLGSVIWCTGFKTNFSWVDVPVFDCEGYPEHVRGVTNAAGLYFLGLPWLYTWGSGRMSGVGRDAQYLADVIAARLSTATKPEIAS